MTQIGESERALRLQVWCALAVVSLAVVVAGTWALLKPRLPLLTSVTVTQAAPTRSAEIALDATAWQVSLWQPFSDAPPPAPKAAPLTFKVFSILRKADGPIAAIDSGPGNPLVYAKTGQRIGEYTVTAIDDLGIEVENGGARQRVELRP